MRKGCKGEEKQTGTVLGQAQLKVKLKLWFTLFFYKNMTYKSMRLGMSKK